MLELRVESIFLQHLGSEDDANKHLNLKKNEFHFILIKYCSSKSIYITELISANVFRKKMQKHKNRYNILSHSEVNAYLSEA